jgi:surface protein
MIPILEYIISNQTKVRHSIKATDKTIKQIVKDELDKLGLDADLNHIDVSEVTNMDSLFSCAFNDLGKDYMYLNPDISKWNVSNVTNMQYMFYGCNKFNCDISKWDISQVINFDRMFMHCSSFNQDLSLWKINVNSSKQNMFKGSPIEDKEEYKPKFK